MALLAYAANAGPVPVDSSANDSASVPAVKALSSQEYTIIAGTDTTVAKPGDSINIVFAVSDSMKATGRYDYQMVNGKSTKVLEYSANGKNFWVPEGSVKGNTVKGMLCDENDADAPMAWYYLLAIIASISGGLVFAGRKLFG